MLKISNQIVYSSWLSRYISVVRHYFNNGGKYRVSLKTQALEWDQAFKDGGDFVEDITRSIRSSTSSTDENMKEMVREHKQTIDFSVPFSYIPFLHRNLQASIFPNILERASLCKALSNFFSYYPSKRQIFF